MNHSDTIARLLVERFLSPPPVPAPPSLPLAGKVTGGLVKNALKSAVEMAYFEGVKDALPYGFVAGLVVALLLAGVIALAVIALRMSLFKIAPTVNFADPNAQ